MECCGIRISNKQFNNLGNRIMTMNQWDVVFLIVICSRQLTTMNGIDVVKMHT